MTVTLSCNLLKVAGFLGFFALLQQVCKKILPKTTKMNQLDKDEPGKGTTKHGYHIACLIASIHGLIATVFCTAISIYKGVTYAQPSEEIHNILISVRKK